MRGGLKPCPNPWCEAAERDGDYQPETQPCHFGNWVVSCTSCSFHGPLRASEAEAIAAWNTRTPTAPEKLVPALAEAGWQDIATAPRDGTRFLACLTVRHINGGSWQETHLIWADDETGCIDNECDQGWEISDYEFWMPLPAAPTNPEPVEAQGVQAFSDYEEDGDIRDLARSFAAPSGHENLIAELADALDDARNNGFSEAFFRSHVDELIARARQAGEPNQ